MTQVNKAIICGRLGDDPKTGETRGGVRYCTFSVATDEKWKDKATGERKSITTWHRVRVWGNDRANAIAKMLKKGSLVYVDGQMHHSKYEKDGQTHYSMEIRVQGFGHTVQPLDRAPGAPLEAPDNVHDGVPAGYDEADDYDRAAA